MTSYLKLSRLLEARTVRSPVVVVVRCMAKQPPTNTSKEPSKKCVKTHCIHPEPKTVFMFMTMIYCQVFPHPVSAAHQFPGAGGGQEEDGEGRGDRHQVRVRLPVPVAAGQQSTR